MKTILLAICLTFLACPLFAQELYVNTEPASNMATGSLGLRLENQGFFKPGHKNRSTVEAMYGVSRHLMVHGSAYVSDYYSSSQHFEGGSVYAKYRFLSIDTVFQGRCVCQTGQHQQSTTQSGNIAGGR
jgi:hypothetical protein